MKRFALMILSVLLCLSMVACSAEPDDDKTKATTETVKRRTSTTATTITTTTTTTRGRLTTTTWSGKGTKVFNPFLLTADEETGLQLALTHGADGTFSPVKEGVEAAKTVAQKNYYWDSWVDLADGERYGTWQAGHFNLAGLSLLDGKLTKGLLHYPIYGSDGRVQALVDAVPAVYNGEDFVPSDRYGFRAVGAPEKSHFESYGQVIDLAFRSEQDSVLTLDTAEESYYYIYYDLEAQQCRALSHLRFIFFDTETGEVLACAKPDVENTKDVHRSNGLKECTGVSIRLINAEGAFLSHGRIVDLMAGQTRRVSILLYLDGETITNADVAAGFVHWSGLMMHFSAASK